MIFKEKTFERKIIFTQPISNWLNSIIYYFLLTSFVLMFSDKTMLSRWLDIQSILDRIEQMHIRDGI